MQKSHSIAETLIRIFRDHCLPLLVSIGLHRLMERRRVLNIYFHGVRSTNDPPSIRHMAPELFLELITYLKKTYRIIPLKDCRKYKGKAITISFDDGYLNLLDMALPVIKALDIPVTVFLAPGMKDPEGEVMRYLINYGRIETGSHTWTHQDLTELDIDALISEIVFSKMSGQLFCFPFARYTDREIRVVEKYHSMMFGNKPDGTKVIPRYCLSNTVPVHVLKAQISRAFINYT